MSQPYGLALDAHSKAERAITMIDQHINTCGDRYSEINTSFARVHAELDNINRSILGTACAVILLLSALLGTLLTAGLPWG